MSYLLDTNVISELRKGARCNPGVSSWIAGTDSEELFLSVLTLGEIRKGIEKIRRRDRGGAESLEAWFTELTAAYTDRILTVDQVIAEEWGRLNVAETLPVIDSFLAATANVHDLTLVTRKVGDVTRTGVEILNPFDV